MSAPIRAPCTPDATGFPNPVIDLAILGRQTHGLQSLQAEVLGLFADHLPVTLAYVREDAAPSDWHYATHTLKGAATAVGATALAAAAAEAEIAEDGDRVRHVHRLHAEAAAAIAFVAAFRADRQGAA